jgi:Cd2+/Zn2+-exporting ATPase
MSEKIFATTRMPLPPHGSRCTDVLGDTLEGYAGIEKADLDLENRRLHIAFDPRILSAEQAMRLIQKSGRQAVTRVMQCAQKSPEACSACAGEMGGELTRHYQSLATLTNPVTTFQTKGQTGIIEVLLHGPENIGRATAELDTSFDGRAPTREAPAPAWRGITRQKVEPVLTGLNALFGLAAFAVGAAAVPGPLAVVLWALSYAAGGYYGLLDGLATMREKRLDVNLLMIFAALGAAAIGAPAEGAILLFLFSMSNTLQTFAMDRSRKAIEKLLDLRPPTASVRRGSRVVTVPVEKLALGDMVLVRPGERLPIDGEVRDGESDINQAPITGESMPVHKRPGDPVFAGTVNGNGAIEMRVTRLAQDTTLARIVQMVEEAQSNKAQTQRMLDDFEQVYALIVLAGAALLAAVPPLLLDQPFYPSFYRAMTWLVVASPCALVISTPASILSAIANGARNGVLFKGGAHLEKAALLKVVAFDKTGTLTSGKPRLTVQHPWKHTSEEELLSLVAAVEARSEHPLAGAIVDSAHARGMTLHPATDTRAIPGQGIEGRVQNQVVWAGGRRMFYERGVALPAGLAAAAQAMEENGLTVIIAYASSAGANGGSSGRFLGLLGLADTIREDAQAMIQAIKRQGIERVVMLTGDNERVAARIAAEAGVDEYYANLLPQDKVSRIKQLKQRYGPVAMVGDGVNDAPALATADVGIAMGGAGADVAMETADIVLMSEDLHKLPHAIGLARSARKIVFQNLSFALAVIILLVISTFGAQLALPLGVVGHEGSTVLVVLNGLRLLGYRA